MSSIEASRYKASRVYVTFDGHRSDDDEPHVLVSEDYGQTWRSIRANLPKSAGTTRDIVEDLENQNVLYLGAEFSAWISIDRGQSWTPLNSNLPTVAIHEFAQHPSSGELVAATHGRSIWILDVTTLRQLTSETIRAPIHLYTPNTAIYWRSEASRGSSGLRRFVGQNPDETAQICYSLGRRARQVKLEILTLEGGKVRELEASPDASLHRLTWDLRGTVPSSNAGRAATASRGGGRSRGRGARRVPTGRYVVALTVDGTTHRTSLNVEADPKYPDGRFLQYEEEAEEIERLLEDEEELGSAEDETVIR